jgi:glycosyltransferase involved in cell wall biosynthesis
MAAKRDIALIYNYSEFWIGGTYYIQNLVAALNQLPAEKKPHLTIFSYDQKHVGDLAAATGYPDMTFRHPNPPLNLISRGINKAARAFFKKNMLENRNTDIRFIFPIADTECLARFSKAKRIFWVPDFQDHFLPEFFDAEELKLRRNFRSYIVHTGGTMVFSSAAAMNDFNTIYPGNKVKQHLLPFAVSHPDLQEDRIPAVLEKFSLPGNFFICSNQFWKHKNHQVILKAAHQLKKMGQEVFIVFTGKEYDYRNPTYFEDLKQQAIALDITDNLRFLGFIEREEQLLLMKHAIAVIQPSLFEGWSTVVEDSKSIGARVIASDIPVHCEQLETYAGKGFFSPLDENQLAECLREAISTSAEQRSPVHYEYSKDIVRFAEKFLQVVESFTV